LLFADAQGKGAADVVFYLNELEGPFAGVFDVHRLRRIQVNDPSAEANVDAFADGNGLERLFASLYGPCVVHGAKPRAALAAEPLEEARPLLDGNLAAH